MTPNELEDRLIDFAVLALKIVKMLPDDASGKVLKYQLSKSGTSPALNYGEVRSAESKKDFIHKNKIVNKELRETYINLKIIKRSNMVADKIIDIALNEANELVAIFTTTINTSSKTIKG